MADLLQERDVKLLPQDFYVGFFFGRGEMEHGGGTPSETLSLTSKGHVASVAARWANGRPEDVPILWCGGQSFESRTALARKGPPRALIEGGAAKVDGFCVSP